MRLQTQKKQILLVGNAWHHVKLSSCHIYFRAYSAIFSLIRHPATLQLPPWIKISPVRPLSFPCRDSTLRVRLRPVENRSRPTYREWVIKCVFFDCEINISHCFSIISRKDYAFLISLLANIWMHVYTTLKVGASDLFGEWGNIFNFFFFFLFTWSSVLELFTSEGGTKSYFTEKERNEKHD